MKPEYRLNAVDEQILDDIRRLLNRLVHSAKLRPEQMVSIAKIQHVLSRIPRPTSQVNVTLGLSYRARQEDCGSMSYWQLSVSEEALKLSCGGSEYTKECGSDSYTSMAWSLRPGKPAEFDETWDRAWMQEDEYSDVPIYGLDFEDCEISIEDDENPLLFDEDENESE
jgi:hypothetical protein